ncbi:MAG: hypothetical protein R3D69_07045 [Xanthobacteraceae bacterium]
MPADLHFTPNATFSGLRGVPLIALSRNSLYPTLTIGADSLTIRVVRRHRLAFREIRKVGVGWQLAWQLIIIPERGWRSFSANFLSARAATLSKPCGCAAWPSTAPLPTSWRRTSHPHEHGVEHPARRLLQASIAGFSSVFWKGKDLMHLNTPQVAKALPFVLANAKPYALEQYDDQRTGFI